MCVYCVFVQRCEIQKVNSFISFLHHRALAHVNILFIVQIRISLYSKNLKTSEKSLIIFKKIKMDYIEYDVESILNQRVRDGKVIFKIKEAHDEPINKTTI